MNNWVSRFGAPTEIISDAGDQFTSATFKDFCSFLGAEHKISSPKNPQNNGLTVRAIKNIKKLLTAQLDSVNWMGLVLLGLRTAVKVDLKCSTAEMLCGQTLRLPRDFYAETRLPRISFPDDIILQIRKFAQSCTTVTMRAVQHIKSYLLKDIQPCSRIFLRHNQVQLDCDIQWLFQDHFTK